MPIGYGVQELLYTIFIPGSPQRERRFRLRVGAIFLIFVSGGWLWSSFIVTISSLTVATNAKQPIPRVLHLHRVFAASVPLNATEWRPYVYPLCIISLVPRRDVMNTAVKRRNFFIFSCTLQSIGGTCQINHINQNIRPFIVILLGRWRKTQILTNLIL